MVKNTFKESGYNFRMFVLVKMTSDYGNKFEVDGVVTDKFLNNSPLHTRIHVTLAFIAIN